MAENEMSKASATSGTEILRADEQDLSDAALDGVNGGVLGPIDAVLSATRTLAVVGGAIVGAITGTKLNLGR